MELSSANSRSCFVSMLSRFISIRLHHSAFQPLLHLYKYSELSTPIWAIMKGTYLCYNQCHENYNRLALLLHKTRSKEHSYLLDSPGVHLLTCHLMQRVVLEINAHGKDLVSSQIVSKYLPEDQSEFILDSVYSLINTILAISSNHTLDAIYGCQLTNK